MQIKSEEHQKRVNKSGRKSKEQFHLGEEVLVQNCKNKKWDMTGVISDIRTAHDGTIVSYELLLNGTSAIRHRRYLKKVQIPEVDDKGVSSAIESNEQGRQLMPGGLSLAAQPEPVVPRRSNRRK